MNIEQQRFIDENKFNRICRQQEISNLFASYLRTLVQYKVVIIADDSGSMSTLTKRGVSRWVELQHFLNTVFYVTETIENNPIDIYFLNREPYLLKVQQLSTISNVFIKGPEGYTPIVPILRHILKESYDHTYLGRIIIIATDGKPTDEHNNINIKQLYDVLSKERNNRDYVTFLACTDKKNTLDYLNEWDKKLPRVDVIADYYQEKNEILSAQGKNFDFSYADYIVKTLMGSVIPALDKLDEENVHLHHKNDCYCTLL